MTVESTPSNSGTITNRIDNGARSRPARRVDVAAISSSAVVTSSDAEFAGGIHRSRTSSGPSSMIAQPDTVAVLRCRNREQPRVADQQHVVVTVDRCVGKRRIEQSSQRRRRHLERAVGERSESRRQADDDRHRRQEAERLTPAEGATTDVEVERGERCRRRDRQLRAPPARAARLPRAHRWAALPDRRARPAHRTRAPSAPSGSPRSGAMHGRAAPRRSPAGTTRSRARRSRFDRSRTRRAQPFRALPHRPAAPRRSLPTSTT